MHVKQFPGYHGITLTADVGGNPENPPVVLMHGGGQTRSSWGDTAECLADNGFYAISLDLRGHGESAWSADGVYTVDYFVADLRAVCATFTQPATLIGASLGGFTALVAVGESPRPVDTALVLVDVTPRLDPEGAANILRFMDSAPNGFASIDEVADAVETYLPHRPRPKDVSGLMRNLRPGEDGRLYWHWDPKFVAGAAADQVSNYQRMAAAARNVRIPTLLVRGTNSEVVTDDSARDFLALVPTAEYAEIGGAHHMVAGDRNTAFSAAVVEFMERRLRHGALGHYD